MFAMIQRLTRRERERATAEQVNVQMKNGLPAVAVRVDDDAIAVFGKAFFACYFRAGQKQVTERFPVIFSGFVERIEMLARDDQNVRRRLRANIVEGDAHVVFVNSRRRNLARNNSAKQTIFAHNRNFNVRTQRCKH